MTILIYQIEWCRVTKLKVVKNSSKWPPNLRWPPKFGCTDYVEITIFTFQGHLEVSIRMAANVGHKKTSFFIRDFCQFVHSERLGLKFNLIHN